MTEKGEEIFISLGSNLGGREDYIRRATALLDDQPGIRVARMSRIYETAPLYLNEQGDFLNCLAELETKLSPRALLQTCLRIEDELGRERKERYGPRVIDLDIVSYGRKVISEDDLKVPHPRLGERIFVLQPLAELSPDWVHPVSGKRIAELLAGLGGEQRIGLYRGGNNRPA